MLSEAEADQPAVGNLDEQGRGRDVREVPAADQGSRMTLRDRRDLSGVEPITLQAKRLEALSLSDISRFWSKVDIRKPDECWPWTAACRSASNRIRCHRQRYGMFGVDKTTILFAHDVAWFLRRGQIPTGLIVMHTCPLSRCCNYRHLQVVTRRTCHIESLKADRGGRRVKLKVKDVKEIRLATVSASVLASRYRVSIATIMSVRARKTWAFISDERSAC